MTLLEFGHALRERAALARIDLPVDVVPPYWQYWRMLSKWNARMNLTGLSLEPPSPEALDRLFLEPLAVAGLTAGAGSMLDIGSGCGSPAIPLAVACRPERLLLVEARQRRATFLREALRQLGIPGAVACCRFEKFVEDPAMEGSFGLVTIRAVRADERMLRAIARVAHSGARVVLFRGDHHGLANTAGFALVAQQLLPPIGSMNHAVVLKALPDVPRGTSGEGA